MKYVASYETSVQITEDSWRAVTRTIIIDDDTTMGQIREWYLVSNGLGENGKMDEIVIRQPEQNPPLKR